MNNEDEKLYTRKLVFKKNVMTSNFEGKETSVAPNQN